MANSSYVIACVESDYHMLKCPTQLFQNILHTLDKRSFLLTSELFRVVDTIR